ncbi:sigma-70 family RNA polymerase sigma factor [Leuconostoc falkenbergense]|nr:sigma-70 family RNA polymerase sigma factor [Leuconostoc falkenbergense]QSB52100.1 sigma-70 family RNA polymerase sigma factor [Leuconostoc falkenbergense]
MTKDRLLATVIVAQKGHDCAYNVLIKHLRPAIFSVHKRKIIGHIKKDDWYSEGLEVLMRCVKKYEVSCPRAKFSTYFITALSNRAIDLLRHHNTEKAQFCQQMIWVDDDEKPIDIATNTYNPEVIVGLRESISQLSLAKSTSFKRAVLQMIGALKYDIDKHDKRCFEQMQYCLKKMIEAGVK